MIPNLFNSQFFAQFVFLIAILTHPSCLHVLVVWLSKWEACICFETIANSYLVASDPSSRHKSRNERKKAFACKDATLTILTFIFVNTIEFKLHISLCIFPTCLYIPDDTCLLHWHDWMQKGGAKTRIFYFCHKSCRQNTLICFRTKCLLSIFRGIHLWRFNTQFKIELGIYFTSGLADMSVKVMAILLFRLDALQVNLQKLQAGSLIIYAKPGKVKVELEQTAER